MLVITATLFVGIAEQTPNQEFTTASAAAPFYRAMAAMFLYDAAVLVIDWLKTPRRKRGRLKPYVVWTIANTTIGIACAFFGFKAIAHEGTLATFGFFGFDLDLRLVAPTIFALACVRTFADYVAGSDKNSCSPSPCSRKRRPPMSGRLEWTCIFLRPSVSKSGASRQCPLAPAWLIGSRTAAFFNKGAGHQRSRIERPPMRGAAPRHLRCSQS